MKQPYYAPESTITLLAIEEHVLTESTRSATTLQALTISDVDPTSFWNN